MHSLDGQEQLISARCTNNYIKNHNPTRGTVKDIANLIMEHSDIITIDTALAHICAAMGKKCILMLPKYYDERWEELINSESSYKRSCKIIKQREYGRWRIEIEDILKNLRVKRCNI